MSAVWNYFKKFNDGPKKKVKCNVSGCSAELTNTGSTTNMISHIQKVHKIEIPTLKPKAPNPKRMKLSPGPGVNPHNLKNGDSEENVDDPEAGETQPDTEQRQQVRLNLS